MRVALQPAFVLHSRAFRETSFLLELFTESHGRIGVLARGARSRFRGLSRPFVPLLASWSGKTELMNLQTLEATAPPFYLMGMGLLSGLYLNELLVRLLPQLDAVANLFALYQQTLQAMQQEFKQRYLRLFEKALLAELGYGLSFAAIEEHEQYCFLPQQGFIKNAASADALTFSGRSLLAFHHDTLTTAEDLRTAKQITRLALAPLLGNKPLMSREILKPLS